MCQAKSDGGQRCASHIRQEIDRARETFTQEPTGDNKANLYAAEYNHGFTKTGIREMRAEKPLEADAAQRVYELRARVAFLEKTNTNPEAWARSCRGDLVEAQKELTGLEIKFRHAKTLHERNALNSKMGVSQQKIEKAWEALSEAQHLSDILNGTQETVTSPPKELPKEQRAGMWEEYKQYSASKARYEPVHLTPLMKKLQAGVSQDEHHYYAHWLKSDPTGTALMFKGRGDIHPVTISKAAKDHKHDADTLSAILSHPNTSSTDLNTYVEHPDEKVRSAIASHPNLSAKASKRLMLDYSQSVKQRLAMNPATAPETLHVMVFHPSYQASVLSNPATDSRTLAEVARGSVSPSAALAIINHPQVTAGVTKSLLSRYTSPTLSRAAAVRGSKEVVAGLATSSDVATRAAVAGNRSAGFEILTVLSKDSEATVSAKAKATLRKLARE